MDFLSPGMLLSGMVIGSVGLGLLIYGKKSGDMKYFGAGLALSVGPVLAPTVTVMWIIAGASLAGLYGLAKWS
jgi:hypothetical protein